jgi:hypothetical protein
MSRKNKDLEPQSKLRSGKEECARREGPDEESKGQYGSLTGLGPGGGSDLEEALDTDDINPGEAGLETERDTGGTDKDG